MRMNDALRRLVLETHDANRIKQAAVADGMITLRADGRRKVLDGLTPIAEVLRVAR